MKAAIVEKPNVIVVRDVAEPVMGDYDALCELLYGATCTGTDSHIIEGVFPFSSPFPTILGHESVGRVVKVGPKARNYRVGDLVTRVGAVPPPGADYTVTWGGFAELGIAKDHWAMAADGLPRGEWAGSRWNQVLPPSVDPRVAPMFTTWRETLSYMTRMGVGQGARLLVIGSGGNGLAFAAHAVLLGARVAMVGSHRSEPAARGVGVGEYFDYKTADLAGALKVACPEGFNFIIDAVGKKGQADRVLPALAEGGRLGVYGMDDFGQITITPSLAQGTFTMWDGGYDEAETHQRVSELVLQGRLDAGAWYDVARACPLADIASAFDALRQHKGVKQLIRLKG